MNRSFGIRIRAAFESEKRWYDINAYGGRQMAIWSCPLILTGVIGFFVSPPHFHFYAYASLVAAAMAIGIPTVLILIWSRRLPPQVAVSQVPQAVPNKALQATNVPRSRVLPKNHPVKWYIIAVLAITTGIASAFIPWLLYRHHIHPSQHVANLAMQHAVNLENYYQTKISSASPHDHDHDNNLAQLPAGYRIFDGIRFHVAGLIQLADGNDVRQKNNPYPKSVEGIPVNRFCQRVCLLDGTVQGAEDHTVVATLVLHYVDGSTAKLDIIYGNQVYDWWFKGSGDVPLAGNTKVAWVGENPTAMSKGCHIRVFETTFINPKPSVRIETIDFVSALSPSAPFWLALTVE